MADNVEFVKALLQEDSWITVTDIADKLVICCGSAYSIIHKGLGSHNICERWVPQKLINRHAISRRRGFPVTDCHRQ
jgi:hypothetical protein